MVHIQHAKWELEEGNTHKFQSKKISDNKIDEMDVDENSS